MYAEVLEIYMKLDEQKFIKIPIKDLAKLSLCGGHLYIHSKEGRKFYVLKPGSYIDREFVKKYALMNAVFDFAPVTDEEVMATFKTLFKELRYLQFEKDLKEKSREIIQFFVKTFSTDQHFLNFAIICFQEFNQIPEDTLQAMFETDMHLFKKSLYSAAFSVIVALTNDYHHFPILRDFYNITFALDVGLCGQSYSYFVAQACNQENKKPGTGQAWLKNQRATIEEIKTFIEHPAHSYAFFQEHADLLVHPELAEIALYQHELSDGQGFPRGIPKSLISSWEAVVLLSDSLVEIEDLQSFETHVHQYLLTFLNEKLNLLPVIRVYKKLKGALEHFSAAKETAS
jgi:hypothetical protein